MTLEIPDKAFDQHAISGGRNGAGMPAIPSGLATIVGLLFFRGPATVARFISLRIVDAVDGMLRRWAVPHVFQELFEIVEPRIAYRDATPAVLGIVGAFGIAASILHQPPDSIFGSLAQMMGAVGKRGSFPLKTSTGEGFDTERGAVDMLFISAVAAADPYPMLRRGFR